MPNAKPDPEFLAARLGSQLLARGLRVATAESCTGGWLAMTLTSVAGSSAWFERGAVTYSNASKHEWLQVPLALLEQQGAVASATVEAMALGMLAQSPAEWAVSISGIAGPGGGSRDKPVGLVWFGFAQRGVGVCSESQQFSGTRTQIRKQAVCYALTRLMDALQPANSTPLSFKATPSCD